MEDNQYFLKTNLDNLPLYLMVIFHTVEYDTKHTLDTKMIKEFFEDDTNVSSLESVIIISYNTLNVPGIIIITEDNKVYLIKDRFGVRPLCYGYSK